MNGDILCFKVLMINMGIKIGSVISSSLLILIEQ